MIMIVKTRSHMGSPAAAEEGEECSLIVTYNTRKLHLAPSPPAGSIMRNRPIPRPAKISVGPTGECLPAAGTK